MGVAYASLINRAPSTCSIPEELCDQGEEDETLLHELVHATRFISGVLIERQWVEVTATAKKFYANMIEDDLSIREETANL